MGGSDSQPGQAQPPRQHPLPAHSGQHPAVLSLETSQQSNHQPAGRDQPNHQETQSDDPDASQKSDKSDADETNCLVKYWKWWTAGAVSIVSVCTPFVYWKYFAKSRSNDESDGTWTGKVAS